MLADDHPAVRAGMRRPIDNQPDMVVVREARSAEEALGDGERSEDVACSTTTLAAVATA